MILISCIRGSDPVLSAGSPFDAPRTGLYGRGSLFCDHDRSELLKYYKRVPHPFLQAVPDRLPAESRLYPLPPPRTAGAAILQLLTHSLEEKRRHDYGYDVLICSDIASILTYLMRCLKQKGVDTDTIITAPDDCDASIYSISKYIEQHCGEPLRVHELAQMCGMSYSYFAKLFRETYNQSCKEYIEFTRINKAADLLLFTNQDLTYISQETGFADCSHLIRTFKKWKGMTPKQWKKSLK